MGNRLAVDTTITWTSITAAMIIMAGWAAAITGATVAMVPVTTTKRRLVITTPAIVTEAELISLATRASAMVPAVVRCRADLPDTGRVRLRMVPILPTVLAPPTVQALPTAQAPPMAAVSMAATASSVAV